MTRVRKKPCRRQSSIADFPNVNFSIRKLRYFRSNASDVTIKYRQIINVKKFLDSKNSLVTVTSKVCRKQVTAIRETCFSEFAREDRNPLKDFVMQS
jgi:hypothetical protein